MKNRNLVVALIIVAIALAVMVIVRIVKASPRPSTISLSGKKNIEAITAQTEGALLSVAELAEKRGDLLKAREAYQKFIEKFTSESILVE